MTSFALKIIAMASMLVDHFAYSFHGLLVWDSFEVMRSVGRLAFPIFAYMAGEGFRHTRDVRKYLVRLGAFALISEVPFDLLFRNSGRMVALGSDGLVLVFFELSSQNVFFTIFLGIAAAYLYKLGRDRPLFLIAIPIPILLGGLMNTDFGSIGVAMVFACAAITGRIVRLGTVLLGGVVLFWPFMVLADPSFGIMLMTFHCIAVGLLLMYNGKRGRKARWTFYLFYPAHLLALFGLLWIMT